MADRNRARVWSVIIPLGEEPEEAPSINTENVRYIAGQKELSDEGFGHWQLCVGFVKPVDLKYVQLVCNVRTVEKAKNPRRLYEYCTKAVTRMPGTVIYTYGAVPNYSQIRPSRQELFRALLAIDNKEEAMEFINDSLPDCLVLQNKALMTFVNSRFEEPIIPPYPISMFKRPRIEFDRYKTWVLVGNTAFGKTSYSLAHFNHPVMISDKSDFGKIIRGKTDGIVIDDIAFNKWGAHNLLHLVDSEFDRTINIKYGQAVIPAGLPRIITLNDVDNFWPESINEATKAAIERRIRIVHVTVKLF